MVFKENNEVNWEPPNPRMTYQRNRANDQLCKNMVAMNYSSSVDNKISDEITPIVAAEFISERYSDYEFALDIGCDMFMPINVPIDWIAIKERKQKAIYKSNERENSKRIYFRY